MSARRRHVFVDSHQLGRIWFAFYWTQIDDMSHQETPTDTATQQLVDALRNPACYPHAVASVRVIETHISWVLLTGLYAYKIKKPVNLGFLDFSTLKARRAFCEEEVRLNRRLAPSIYLEVAPLSGTPRAPRVGDAGAPFEYAVKMREFAQESLLDQMLARGTLTPALIDALAARVASFHQSLTPAAPISAHGTPEAIAAPARQNLRQIEPLVADADERELLVFLRRWTEAEFAARTASFARRRAEGRVRECHGDLHLGNIAWVDGEITAFDCIEFDPELRWIDVMSEIAFLVMDLADRRHPGLAWRCLNAYLEITGDYDGLAVLRFYLVYRALVRAKVIAIRMRQHGAEPSQQPQLGAQLREYLELAHGFAAARRPALIITHGVTGSGKTSLTQSLLEQAGMIRVRSDVERKRLHGMDAHARNASGIGMGIYGRDTTARTYERLAAIAADTVQAGYPLIVDATFLARAQRDRFRALAEVLRVPFVIADVYAPEPLLRERIARRALIARDASDADAAVLAQQIAQREPLTAEERASTVTLDSEQCADPAALRPLLDRLRG